MKGFIIFSLSFSITLLSPVLAQVETISTYHNLSACTFLSATNHPTQIARILPERSGKVQLLQLHLDGGIGNCQIHLYGQEGGTNFPQFQKDLIPPIHLIKDQVGDTSITVPLTNPLFIENDQFYIALTDFEGNFGIKQDSTYYKDFCVSSNGGNYYPTLLLSRDSSQWIGDNCAMAMDITILYEPITKPILKEITAAVGLPMDISNRSIAWADVNKDGWIDVLLGQQLFLNKDAFFKKVILPISSHPKNSLDNSSFIDMDNDGHWDILLFGRQKSLLLQNGGQADFTVHPVSIPPLPALQAYSIADINNDTYPDIALAQLWGNYPEPMPNFLLLNNGQLDFTDITKRLYPYHNGSYNFPQGIPCIANIDTTYLPNKNRNRRSRATQFIDADMDGDTDLYIANYFLETDEFYLNYGNGFFVPRTPPKPHKQSTTTSNHGTGVAWYDYDNDGDFDLLVPQLAHPRFMLDHDHRGTTLYRNDDGILKDVTATSGIQYEETHAGACFGDINNDGLVDLLITAYYGCRYIEVYLQQPDHTFHLSTYQTGLSKISSEADACFVDFNEDGQLDIALGDSGKFRLYKNQLTANNWLKIELRATSIHHFGPNVLVKVYTKDAVYTQASSIGKGQKMQPPSILHFGLGTATSIAKVEVYFDQQVPVVYENLSVNNTYIIHE